MTVIAPDLEEQDLLSAAKALAELRGLRVHFDPLKGDNGTRLIEIGSRWLIDDIGLNLVSHWKQADVIVMNGGIWNGHRAGAVRRYSTQRPDVPIIIMPTTYTVAPALPQRQAPITLLARDLPSLEILRPMESPFVRIGLDHDAALLLPHTPFFQTVRRKAQSVVGKHVLVVERQDRESSSQMIISSELFSPISLSLKRKVPLDLRMAIKRPVNRKRWQSKMSQMYSAPLVREGFAWLSQTHPHLIRGPLPADVGLPDFYSFDEYVRYISEASAVLTTRLHVAIFAGLLGKQTYLRPGANHKIPGVYQYSLRNLPNVTFVP